MKKPHKVRLNKNLTTEHGNSKTLGYFINIYDNRLDEIVVKWSDETGFKINKINTNLAHISDSTALIAAANKYIIQKSNE